MFSLPKTGRDRHDKRASSRYQIDSPCLWEGRVPSYLHIGNDPNLENISAFQIVMADDAAERFSSFPRLEGHFPMNLEAGGGGSSREKRDAAAAEGDQGECSHCRRVIPFLIRTRPRGRGRA